MNRSYNVKATTLIEVKIEPDDIARILSGEKDKLAGGKDCYINSDGTIFDVGGRWTEKIGDATEEQAKLYDALELCIKYLKDLK